MNKYKALLSNTVIFAIGTFSSKMLVFLLMPLYTRVLDNNEYGTVDLIIQTGNMLLPLVSIGIINGVIRFGLDKTYHKKDVFSTGVISVIIGFTVLLLFEPLLSKMQYIQGHTALIYVFILMSSLRSLCSQFVRAKGLVRLYAFDGILSTITTILFNLLYLVALNWGILGYVLAIVSSDFLSIMFLMTTAKLGRYIKFRGLDSVTFWAMLRYSIPLIPNTLFWWITNVSDRYLVTYMVPAGAAANGLYAVAYKIPTVINLVSSIFMDAWQMAAVSEKKGKKRDIFFSRVFYNYQSLIFTAASGLILFSKLITMILVSEDFYESWQYIPFLLMATTYSCMVSFLGSVYMVEKKSVMNLVTTASGAILNIIFNLLLIPKYGVNGAAFATFISYFSVFLLRVLDTKRYMKVRWQAAKIALNTIVLLLQSWVLIAEFPFWILIEILLTGVMMVLNLGAILASLRKILVR